MWARGLAVIAAWGLWGAGLCSAWAGESRASLSMSTYVAVAGSINATTAFASSTSQSGESANHGAASPASSPAAAPAGVKLGACAAVSLSCKGPRSMRITIHADGERLKTENADSTVDWSSEANGTDLCAARDAHASTLSMCSSDQSTNNTLGVTVDY